MGLYEKIQFSISMPLDLFNPEIGPLSDATTLGQSGPGSNGNKMYSSFPRAPALLEPHHLIV